MDVASLSETTAEAATVIALKQRSTEQTWGGRCVANVVGSRAPAVSLSGGRVGEGSEVRGAGTETESTSRKRN